MNAGSFREHLEKARQWTQSGESVARLSGMAGLTPAAGRSEDEFWGLSLMAWTGGWAGACLALLNAALAMGWGANWLTGWASYSREFMEQELGLSADEFVAGFIHIGNEQVIPSDRDRPDISVITEWR